MRYGGRRGAAPLAHLGFGTMSGEIRVLLVEDQRMLREGLRTILELEEGIAVVGEAENGARAVALAAELAPDVVLMDLKMPVLDGVEATRRIIAAHPGTKVVVLTTYDHDSLVINALRAGATGYLLKDDPADEMIRAIHLAHRGESLLQPGVAAKLLDAFMRDTPHPSPGNSGIQPDAPSASEGHGTAGAPWTSAAEPRDGARYSADTLTERELQVLVLVAEGASNGQIARRLSLAEGTVKNHLSLIMDKLGAANRTQAVAIARQRGLLGR